MLEESGVQVRDVTYVASQPWPFPSQLMIGCHSHADSEELTIDETEMAEIDWYTREEVEAAMVQFELDDEKGEEEAGDVEPD